MHADLGAYYRFTGPARLEKSINSLLGIVEGISIDGRINRGELDFLGLWLSEHAGLRERHPFSELIPVVDRALADGVLDPEERADIQWLCEKLSRSEYFDRITADLQRLHAILGGVVADTRISEQELRGLSDWMEEHSHLRSCWPFDEIGSLVVGTLQDGRIDDAEHRALSAFFSEFVSLLDATTVVAPPILEAGMITGLCAVDPEILFEGRVFCFTGTASRGRRKDLEATVRKLGGDCCSVPSSKTDYLVIGADGNPCWTYACYGRKVEKAVSLRRKGVQILLVHELDFHDAVADVAH